MTNPSNRTMAAPSSPALSATSSTASTTATVVDAHPNPKSLSNLVKQLKYLAIGATLVVYFQVGPHLSDALSLGLGSSSGRWAGVSLALLVGTVAVFTYTILLPARGFEVNYVEWRSDRRLGTAIPLLTACIIAGWLALLLALSPVGAPAPPALGIKQRLSQAAANTGWHELQPKINAIPASFFPAALVPEETPDAPATPRLHKLATLFASTNRKPQPQPASTTTAAAAAAAEKTWTRIASYLSLPHPSSDDAAQLHSYFLRLSARADEWASHNLMTIGWTGALLGSIGTYLAVLGAVGLLGFVAPDNRTGKAKTF